MPRRVPVPALRPALAQCLPTGVTLDEGARVVVMRDEGGIADALVERLTKAGVAVLALDPGTSTEALLSAIEAWRAEGPVTGVYWLAALDDEGPHEALDLAGLAGGPAPAGQDPLRDDARLYDDSPFLVTGTRMGGYHGYDDAGATAPMGGAVTGFAKSYKKERPEALVKAVDLPVNRKTAQPAQVLIDETLRDPGCIEVGHVDGLALGRRARRAAIPAAGPAGAGALALGPDSVVLVTGAAGSIVSAITADLAKATGGIFHLLDLTPMPDSDDPDLRRYLEDRDGLKTDLAQRMRDRGDRPTPVARPTGAQATTPPWPEHGDTDLGQAVDKCVGDAAVVAHHDHPRTLAKVTPVGRHCPSEDEAPARGPAGASGRRHRGHRRGSSGAPPRRRRGRFRGSDGAAARAGRRSSRGPSRSRAPTSGTPATTGTRPAPPRTAPAPPRTPRPA